MFTVIPDHTIEIEIFNRVQIGIFETQEKLSKWLEEIGFPDEYIEPNENGSAQKIKNPRGKVWFILYLPKKANIFILIHEAVHLAYFILDHHGIVFDIDNHEVFAYLVDYIVRKIKNKDFVE